MHASVGLLAAIAAIGAARTIVIAAGLKGFTFFPAIMTADVGDTLEFQFFYSTHTAVESDFSTPCQGSSSGFDSGPISSADVFQVTVQSTDPIWYFCSTPTHCQGGMAGVINPPSSNETLEIYIANAAKTSSSSSAGKVQGGVVLPASSSSSSSSPSPTSTPSSTMPSSASSSTPATISTSSPSVSSSASGSGSGSSHGTATTSSSSVASSASSSPTSRPSPTVSPVTTGGGVLLMMSVNTFLLGTFFGLGVVAVMV